MTLRKKTLLITGITLLGLIAVSYVISSAVLLRGFESIEKQDTLRNVSRALEAINDNISNLNKTAGDWAFWDDMYAFIADDNPEFVSTNLVDSAYTELQLNLIALITLSGKVLYCKAFDLERKSEMPVPDGILKMLSVGDPVLQHRDEKSSHAGFVALPEGMLLLASRPVLTSEGKGPVRGSLVMGQYLDSKQIEYLEKKTHLNLAFYPLSGEQQKPDDVISAIKYLSDKNPILVRPINDRSIIGYSELKDIYGNPASVLRVDLPRVIYREGQKSLGYLMIWLLLAGLVFGLMTILLLEKLILSRLVRLSEEVSVIGVSGDLAGRVSVKGDDEVSTVAEKINKTLSILENYQKGLQEVLSRFEAVIDRAAFVAIQCFNKQGTILYWNEASNKLFGIEAKEALGKRIQDVIVKSDAIKDLEDSIRDACESGRATPPREWEVRLANGENRALYGSLFPVAEDDGVSEIFAMQVDITDRKCAEERVETTNRQLEKVNEQLKSAMERAQKLALAAQSANVAKSEFLARMSHEIRTPLNAVIGFTDMLFDSSLNGEQIDYAHTIKKNGEALLALINDILDFSKIEAKQLNLEQTEFDPEVTAYDVCDTIYPRVRHKNVEILCRIGDEVPALVKGDPGRFRQILLNLMGNAAKFTASGEIELALDIEEEREQQVKLHVVVRDTGIGIPQDKLESIFEVFQQVDSFTARKYGGTGLGLAICKQLAGLMDGDVWVEPGSIAGSIFHFEGWFGEVQKRQERRGRRISLMGKKVLVVDDNKTNLDIMKHFLEAAGMRCFTLTKGAETMPTILQHFELNDPFNLCILDIQMPEMSGYEIAQKIRDMDSSVSALPLMAFSSSAHFGAKRSHHAGFNAFLQKPARREKLLEMIESLMVNEGVVDSWRNESLMTQYTLMEDAKHSIRILLVEDNPASQMLAEKMLSKAGYHVELADNGLTAVKLYLAAPDQFDLIFMDVQMPEMDGLQATHEIRSAGFHEVPIVAMTANAMEGDRDRCLSAGMNDYLAKPIRRELVYEVIKKWVLGKDH